MPEATTTDQSKARLETARAVTSLTALWGLTEAGLGGLMHAFRVPFSALLVGGISVVLLRMIAYHSNNNFKQILGVTAIVIMIKAAVSPHSPPPAYLAVLFQGFAAAFLFSRIKNAVTASVLLGVLAMVESAAQKLLMLTLVFGKSLWQAVNGVSNEVAKDLSFEAGSNMAVWIISGHLVVYGIWGGIAGAFAATLPKKIFAAKSEVLVAYEDYVNKHAFTGPVKRKSRRAQKFIFYFGLLLFIVLTFVFAGASGKKVLEVILRSAAAVLLLLFVLGPLLRYALKRWLAGRSEQQRVNAEAAMELMPALRSFVPVAWRIAGERKHGLAKLRLFLIIMIVLSLYARGSLFNVHTPQMQDAHTP